jgi:hypothetical protein
MASLTLWHAVTARKWARAPSVASPRPRSPSCAESGELGRDMALHDLKQSQQSVGGYDVWQPRVRDKMQHKVILR